MTKYRVLLLFFISIIIASPANSGIIVDKMVIDVFPKDLRQQNVFVHNNENEISYVTTEIFEIENPGKENETRNPINIRDKNRLIVAPNKLTIEPTEKRRLQFIINNESLEEDKIYRVSVLPVISEIEKSNKIGIKILIGYDILVIVRPDKPNFNLKVLKNKDTITFINNGNTNILLNNVRQCKNDNNCTTIFSKRLYAGNKSTVKLIYRGRPIIAEVFYGKEFKLEKY